MAKPPLKSVRQPELRLDGTGAAAGIAIGHVFRLPTLAGNEEPRTLQKADVRGELDRLHNAIIMAHAELDSSMRGTVGLPANAAEEINRTLEAHKVMLEGSRLTRGVERRILKQMINAEAALQQEVEAISHSFTLLEDRYLAARGADVRAVGALLLTFLLQLPARTIVQAPAGAVIVADDITPNDTAQINPKHIAGLVTSGGGPEGHTAIMARALGLPAVMNVPEALARVQDGDPVILDGREGLVIIHPTAATLRQFKALRERIETSRKELKKLKRLPAKTKDGTLIRLCANLEQPEDVKAAREANADGVGLLRTEFLFMGRDTLPDADEQFEVLRRIVEGMEGKPVTIRTLDVGGEKVPPALARVIGKSANPALGLRGIRLSLAEPDLLTTQFIAALKASKQGPIRLMLPMVTNADEVKVAKALLQKAAKSLGYKGKLPELGLMIEVPAAALLADNLAKVSDFFAIGTNDLTQYTLAADRADDKVAALFDSRHPAVLALIERTAKAGAKAKIPVSICGEVAGDARATATLIGLGIRELSMTPSSILTVKKAVRAV